MDTTDREDDQSTPTPPRPPVRHGLLGRIVGIFVIAALFLLAYLVFAPSPIDPLAYDPPPMPEMIGPLAPNNHLEQAELLAQGYAGPEDVFVDTAGSIYSGLEDGRVIRVLPDGKVEEFANTQGRPLGMELDADGNLIVADARRGLVSIAPDGAVTVLTTAVDGVPFGFCDDLAIAADGVIYFSDASVKFGADEYLYDLLEARPHGRLLAYDPRTKETRLLLDGLYFANGVAVAQDQSFLVVNETYRHRMQRYWLSGEKAGTAEIFVDNLPGFPDNVTSSGRGTFWVALFTVRNSTIDSLHPRPWAKSMLAKLPKSLWPKPEPYGFAVEIDEQGNILQSVQDPSGKRLSMITSAFERDGYLYLGTLINDCIGKLKLP